MATNIYGGGTNTGAGSGTTGGGTNLWDPNSEDRWLTNFLTGNSNLLGQQQGFSNQLEPLRQNSIMQWIQAQQPGNIEADVNRMGRINSGIAGQNSMDRSAAMRAGGAGSGAIGGSTEGQYNQAAHATNQYANQAYSPEAQQQRLMQMLGVIQGGQSNPAFGQTMQAQGASQSLYEFLRHLDAQQQQGGLGGLFGSVLGMVTGGGGGLGWLKGLFGNPNSGSSGKVDPTQWAI